MGSVISDRWSESDRKLLRLCKKKKKEKGEPMGSVISDRWIRERSKASSFMYKKKKNKRKRRADGQCNLRSMDQRDIESFFVYVKKKKKKQKKKPMDCAISTR